MRKRGELLHYSIEGTLEQHEHNYSCEEHSRADNRACNKGLSQNSRSDLGEADRAGAEAYGNYAPEQRKS